jgi:hypothetical protein
MLANGHTRDRDRLPDAVALDGARRPRHRSPGTRASRPAVGSMCGALARWATAFARLRHRRRRQSLASRGCRGRNPRISRPAAPHRRQRQRLWGEFWFTTNAFAYGVASCRIEGAHAIPSGLTIRRRGGRQRGGRRAAGAHHFGRYVNGGTFDGRIRLGAGVVLVRLRNRAAAVCSAISRRSAAGESVAPDAGFRGFRRAFREASGSTRRTPQSVRLRLPLSTCVPGSVPGALFTKTRRADGPSANGLRRLDAGIGSRSRVNLFEVRGRAGASRRRLIAMLVVLAYRPGGLGPIVLLRDAATALRASCPANAGTPACSPPHRASGRVRVDAGLTVAVGSRTTSSAICACA